MGNVDFNLLRDKAYKIAKDKGFHDENYSDEHYLVLVISELSEALELIREAINDAEFEYTLQQEREIEENGMLETYNLICHTQGLSRYC
jgi:hypothetical protein